MYFIVHAAFVRIKLMMMMMMIKGRLLLLWLLLLLTVTLSNAKRQPSDWYRQVVLSRSWSCCDGQAVFPRFCSSCFLSSVTLQGTMKSRKVSSSSFNWLSFRATTRLRLALRCTVLFSSTITITITITGIWKKNSWLTMTATKIRMFSSTERNWNRNWQLKLKLREF